MSTRRQHIRNTRAYLDASFTPLLAEYPYDTTLNTIRVGDGATLGGYLIKRWGLSYPLAPAQITANQNDYNPTDLSIAETVLLNSDAARNITGLAGGSFGRNIKLINRGSFEITLKNSDAGSTAANRFLFDADLVLQPRGSVELQWSSTDSRWMRTSGGTKFATVSQELLLTGVISPAQITANQNDYAPAGVAIATTLRLSTDATRNLTGLVDARDGAMKMIINVGSNSLVLKNADAGSTAANRFDFGADVTLNGKQAALLRYDGTDSRWKLLSQTGGSAVAAGAVTAQTVGGSALGARTGLINGTLVESRSAGAATFAVKTLAGADPSSADPVLAVFNTGAGAYAVRTISAALSLTISSGSSMGVVANSTAFRLWLLLIDNAGTAELAAVNCTDASGTMALHDGMTVSTTAEGGAGGADSIKTIYSAAARASKYPCLVGHADYDGGLASVGAWSVAPSRIILYGPGGKKPGEVVQSVTATFASSTSTVSSSYVTTGLSASITPTAAPNVIHAEGGGILRSSTTGIRTALRFARTSNANMFGEETLFYNNASLLQMVPAHVCGDDLPGTASALTYYLMFKSDGTNASIFGDGVLNTQMKLQEVMA
ncbi:hypothetical protein [Rhodopseudomonas sp. RCAM05734]|uniref:hypothetical protein n=1 Tax=Rhodopseudomonas sp. RCAM05734 TaxID=3457549 RepID=UPI004043DB41